ncbi:MAG: YjbH domain-containing protein [Panacagrimonas sp.]
MRSIPTQALATVLGLMFCIGSAQAYPEYSSNDFGGVGLMQVPTARFAPDGEFHVGLSTADPYNQILLGLQWLPWLETGFRYTEVDNRLYGPEAFSGDQTYKDRSIDVKLRIRDDVDLYPAIAIGLRDVGGTGLFASEYLVFTKDYAKLDWTLGIAWGRLGARGGIRNPLASLSDRFDDRPRTGGPGDLGLERLFGGSEIGLFGGVQWQSPVPHLSVKLEIDGNDYRSETLDNDQDVDSPISLGLNYRLADVLDIAAGIERGNTFMFRIALYSDFNRTRGPLKVLDAVPTPVAAVLADPPGSVEFKPTARIDRDLFERLSRELQRQSISLKALDADTASGTLTVWFLQSLSNDPPRVMGRIGQTLAVMAPPGFEHFTVVNLAADTESYRVTLVRADIQKAIDFHADAEDLGTSAVVAAPLRDKLQHAAFQAPSPYPDFSWAMGPALRQHIGGPDDFYFGQLWWRVGANLVLSPRWNFSGAVGADIYNNFDGLKQRSDSRLPRVRSDIVQYLKKGENNLVRLETNYVWSPLPSWYARLSAGIFEEMYGGVAAEMLYRRAGSDWAIGANLNRVRQRDFDQRFDFRDYEVTTGHLSSYFDLPFYDMSARLSVGRYLAGDRGATLELSRRFASGMVAGVFATKTNVSSEDFGEGSFDRGLFLFMPFDLFFAKSTRRAVPLVFRPLTRDGGQRVRDGVGLFDITESGHLDADADWSEALR